jgi:uncharacterized phage protein (TIGR02218 family)
MQLRCILDDTFQKYVANQPIEPVTITVYRILASDPTQYVVVFKGSVMQVSIEGNQVSAKCEAKSQYLSKRIPNVIHQSFCNHDVYDTGCALNDAAWKVSATITTVSGASLVAAAFNDYADDYFKGGWITYDGDMRLITSHTQGTSTVTLQIPFDSRVYASVTVDVYPGCDGNPSTCVNKFNNLVHFLGMPYISSRNPSIYGFR